MTEAELHQILRIQAPADEAAIRRAYRKCALDCHPDRDHRPGAEERFKQLVSAYQELTAMARQRRDLPLRCFRELCARLPAGCHRAESVRPAFVALFTEWFMRAKYRAPDIEKDISLSPQDFLPGKKLARSLLLPRIRANKFIMEEVTVYFTVPTDATEGFCYICLTGMGTPPRADQVVAGDLLLCLKAG